MISSKTLKEIVSEARPIIERQLDDAEMIAGLRDVVANAGGDWSALKALIKAQIQDERDETGNGKRVKKILDKAGFSTDYASLLGWSNMNEKNFSADEEFDRETGEVLDRDARRRQRTTEAMDDHKTLIDEMADAGLISEEARHEKKALADAVATKFGNGPAKALQSPRKAAEAVAEMPRNNPDDGNADQGMATTEATAVTVGETTGEAASAVLPANFPSDDDAIAAVNGKAGLANVTDVEPSSSVHSSDQPLTGGDHVERAPSAATHQAGASFKAPPAKPLRPNCLRPDNCAGFGSNHCYSCGKAAKADEVAA